MWGQPILSSDKPTCEFQYLQAAEESADFPQSFCQVPTQWYPPPSVPSRQELWEVRAEIEKAKLSAMACWILHALHALRGGWVTRRIKKRTITDDPS